METRVKTLREEVKGLSKSYNKTEDDLKALQSVGQIIGDVLKQLDDERFIVKASSGPRYVVGCRTKLDKATLKPGTRVSLDMTTLTIMRRLPREVDPTVFHMLNEDPGGITFSQVCVIIVFQQKVFMLLIAASHSLIEAGIQLHTLSSGARVCCMAYCVRTAKMLYANVRLRLLLFITYGVYVLSDWRAE